MNPRALVVPQDMEALPPVSSSVSGNIAGIGSTQINAPVTIGGPRSQKEKFKALRDELLARVGPSTAKQDIADGTCEWILSNEVFRTWLQSSDYDLLWICGGPGKGKSHLAAYLCDELARSTEPKPLILTFFCQNSDNRRNSSLAVQLSLLYQILMSDRADADMHNDVSSLLNDPHTDLNGNLARGELWQLIKGFVNRGRNSIEENSGQVQRKIYFILDGLDECDTESIRDLTRKLEGLAKVEKRQGRGQFKAIVLSRPLVSSKSTTSLINLDDYERYHEQMKAEIRLFIDWKMRRRFENREEELKSLKTLLSARSNQTFLWVALALKLLETRDDDLAAIARGKSSESLDRLLPLGLVSMYNRILLETLRGKYNGRPNSRPAETAKIIRYICVAYIPLTGIQLQIATGNRLGFSDSIQCCRNMLSGDTEEGPLHLVHLSLKEYLQRGPYFTVPSSWAHRLWPMLASLVDVLRASMYRIYFIDHCLLLALFFHYRSFIIRHPIVPMLVTVLCIPGFWKRKWSLALQLLLSVAQTILDLCVLGIFVVPERATHKELFDECLTHLMDEKMGLQAEEERNLQRPGALSSKQPQSVDDKLSQFGQYACRFWAEHLCSLSDTELGGKEEMPDGRDERRVLEFLDQKFLHWMRNLALQGKVREGIQSIRRLAYLFQDRNDSSSGLVRWLNDAERFTLRFAQTVEQAPFQIYGTAMVFAPSESAVRRSLWSQVLPFVKDVCGIETTWSPLLQVLEGHTQAVRSVAFSPDGKTIASASSDDSIRLWDIATGSQNKILHAHFSVWDIAGFSPDGSTIAIGSGTRLIGFWDTHTGDLVKETDFDEISHVWALSPDGNLVAGSSDLGIILFSQRRDGPPKILNRGAGGRISVRFSPDGKLVAVASEVIKVWDTASGALIFVPETHTGPELEAAFSPDDSMMAFATSQGTVHVRDRPAWTPRWECQGHSDWVTSLAFSPDSAVIASGSHDWTIQLWNSKTGDTIAKLKGHVDIVNQVAFSPSGRTLASASVDGTVRLWDPAIKPSEDHLGPAKWTKCSPDGDAVAVVYRDNSLKCWSLTARSSGILSDRSEMVYLGAFSPDGKYFASVSDNMSKTVQIWDIAKEEVAHVIGDQDDDVMPVVALAFSQDGKTLALAGPDYMGLWTLCADSDDGPILSREIKEVDITEPIVIFSPRSDTIAFTSRTKVWLYGEDTDNIAEGLHSHERPVTAITFSSDGTKLASASRGGRILRLRWGVSARGSFKRSYRTLQRYGPDVTALSFAFDDTVVISSSGDCTVRFWDAESGTLRGESRFFQAFSSLSLSTCGGYLTTDMGVGQLVSEPSSGNARLSLKPHVLVDGEWVFRGSEKVLWLPSDYRAIGAAYSRAYNRLAICNKSGRVVCLELSS